MKRPALLLAALMFSSSLAFAQGGTSQDELQPRARKMAEAMWMKMADKDGMITKKQYMDMVSQKWDEMDKGKKGMIPAADAARIMVFLSGMGTSP